MITSGVVAMMHVQCLAVPIAGVFEWLWLGTTFSVFELACTGVVVAGVVVALAPNEKKQGIADARLAGIMFGILGAAGQAFGVVPSREAYAVLHGAGETLDGGTAAYQRIIGGVAVATPRDWASLHSRPYCQSDRPRVER